MKHSVLFFLALTATVVLAGKTLYVTPINSTNLFAEKKHSSEAAPVATVSKGEHLKVLESEKGEYFVETDSNTKGWVSKKEVAKVDPTEIKDFAADTVQYSDPGLSPDVIPDGGEPEVTDAIIPERSFKDALQKNADKDAIVTK